MSGKICEDKDYSEQDGSNGQINTLIKNKIRPRFRQEYQYAQVSSVPLALS